MFDLASDIKVVNAVNSAAVTDSTDASAAIDLAGFESVTVVAQMAAYTSGGGKIAITESDSSTGAFTAVAEEDLINLPTEMEAAGAVDKVGYRGHKQFIKVGIDKVSSLSATVGAVVVLGDPRHKPAV